MRRLRKFNESSESEFDTIKDILLEIKDKYVDIDGQILEIEKADGVTMFSSQRGTIEYMIELDCDRIKVSGVSDSIEHWRFKQRFTGVILDCCERLERALSVKVKVPHLQDFDHWQYSPLRIYLIKLDI